MKDIMFDDIDFTNSEIKSISAVEKSYDWYEITCYINGESYRITDTRNSRCSDMVFIDTQHEKGHAIYLLKKLGGNEKDLIQRFIHNPTCWEDNYEYGDEVDYIGDGLDTYYY